MPKEIKRMTSSRVASININKVNPTLQGKEENGDNSSGDESNGSDGGSDESFDENLDSAPRYSRIQHLQNMKIISGKIITTKRNIMFSRWFENTIIFMIIANSLALILDNPLNDPKSWLSITLSYLDIFFTIVFTIEAIMKIIALGFFYNNLPGISGYILNGWNILDFFIVVASLVDLSFTISSSNQDTSSLKSLKALRAFRALRPLRVISRNEGLQIVVNTLFSSIPAMTNVMLVTMLLLVIFAIMGVNFFKGEFHYCELGDGYTDEQKASMLKSIDDKDDCIAAGGDWENYRSNFDNIFTSLLTLFEMMSTEGWTTVMFNGMDATGINKQPKKNAQAYY